MGIFGNIVNGIKEQYQQSKEQIELERHFICINPGTEVICAYIKNVFNKDEPGYNWLKENKLLSILSTPLYPVVGESYVSLCYMQPGDGRSWESSKPKDIEVARYTFQEMYKWYGLENGVGYKRLDSKTKRKILESLIISKVEELPHIKYNAGFVVKMFS